MIIDGVEIDVGFECEYLSLYICFFELIGSGESDVDVCLF